MRIVYDNIIFSFQQAGGVSVYWYELIRRAIRDGLALTAIEAKGAENNLFRTQIAIPRERILHDMKLPVPIMRYLPPMVRIPREALFHSSYYRVPFSKSLTNVVTVHDFTYERFRNGLPRLIHSYQKRIAVTNADGIICISESTKRDLLTYFPRLDVKPIKVIPHGFGEEFRRLAAAEVSAVFPGVADLHDRKFVVFVGHRHAYKNFRFAVEAVSRIPDHSLAVVGGGPLNVHDKRMLEKMLAGRYVVIGSISGADLNRLLNNAVALVYPSSYEGFGIPILEAMAAGCPVIATNASAIPEVCGEAALLVDEPSPDSITSQIERLRNLNLRNAIIEQGLRNSAKFCWEACYRSTIDFYSEVQKANLRGKKR